ncbi:DUF2335 domain-containing protein [Streptomyces sp. NPDC056690]|uniref:DUF2335 domain-containing protein n=1 Tax=unclassified Streptomyces TaxID=2593676 RepID=UPI003625BC8A
MSGGAVERSSYWNGFPAAEEIRELDQLHAGLGLRAFAMVERQQQHEHRARWAGIILSSSVAFGSLIGACYFLTQGNSAGGAALSFSSSAGIITTYLSRLLPDRSARAAEPPPTTAAANGAAGATQ